MQTNRNSFLMDVAEVERNARRLRAEWFRSLVSRRR